MSADDLLLWLAFECAARAHAEAPAVIDAAGAGTTLTYGALLDRAHDAASRLERVTDGPGSVVALIAFDPASTLPWMLGALRAGASVMAVSPTQPERDAQLRLVQPDVTVACDAAANAISRDSSPVRSELPPGIVVCTAGTTGTPKAVVHTHATLAHAVRRLQLFRLESAGTPDRVPAGENELRDDLIGAASAPALGLRYATTLPLTTMAGLTVALQALLAGDCVIAARPTDPLALMNAIAPRGVTNLSLTPLLAQLVLRAARQRRLPGFGRLTFAGIGGGPVAPAIANALETTLGCAVAVGYGTTEAGGALAMGRITDPPEVRHNTVGRPLPGVDVAIHPQTGELVVRCASTAVGYVTAPGVLTTLDRSEYRTGDLAVVRRDGEIELGGRVDALIVRAGRNIDPVSIEHVLESHPGVAHAAAFGAANPLLEGVQDIWSVVVLDRPVGEPELRAYCNRELGPALTPRRIVIVDTLPRTADGAVRRHELASLARSAETAKAGRE